MRVVNEWCSRTDGRTQLCCASMKRATSTNQVFDINDRPTRQWITFVYACKRMYVCMYSCIHVLHSYIILFLHLCPRLRCWDDIELNFRKCLPQCAASTRKPQTLLEHNFEAANFHLNLSDTLNFKFSATDWLAYKNHTKDKSRRATIAVHLLWCVCVCAIATLFWYCRVVH